MTVRYDYSVDWAEYDELRRKVLGAYLGWIPVALVVTVLSVVFPAFTPVFIVPALSYLLWFIRVRRQLYQWPCPQCGKPYFVRDRLFNHRRWFALKCVHCSLPKYEIAGEPLGRGEGAPGIEEEAGNAPKLRGQEN